VKPDTEAAISAEIDASREQGGQIHVPTPLGDAPVSRQPYVDVNHYRKEMERVFWRAWVSVARIADLPEPGSYITFSIERARIVVTRDLDGVLHAFHNSCRHRGTELVAADRGCAKVLSCPYHRWVYGLDGTLQSVPEPRSHAPDFDIANIRLKPVAVDTAWGWLWVNLGDQSSDLGEYLGDNLMDELENWALPTVARHSRTTVEGQFGWKVAVEGFLEAFHVPFVHRRTVSPVVNHKKGTMAWWGDHSRMVNEMRDPKIFEPDGFLGRPAAAAGVEMFPRLNSTQRSANFVYHVFPNMIFNLLPTHFTVLQMWPLGVSRTRMTLDTFGAEPTTHAQRDYMASVHQSHEHVLSEDKDVFEAVQRGLDSTDASDLIFCHHDRRIRNFHHRLQAWVNESA